MFKFLHVADIHLDSPLRGLDRYDGAPVEEIRGATRKALKNLVDTALDESVDFVVLAGDLYDGDWRDFNTGLFFVAQMARLREAGIPVYGVQGNHDAASKITRHLRLPENVHIFPTGAAASVRVGAVDVVIHGQSFAEQCNTADLARDYPAVVEGCFNIGVLHTSMSGREGHGNYAPCSESCLRESGYDYWALGHIHQREVIAGSPTIAFPGNIQGRHIRETGAKGCLIVEVADNHQVTTEFKPLDVMRWEVVEVEIEGVTDPGDVLERAASSMRLAVEKAEGRMIAARVVLVGETPISRSLDADRRQLIADVRATAIDIGSDGLWVEKITNQAHSPAEKVPAPGDETPLTEVAALVRELSASAQAGGDLGIDFRDLVRKLPSELTEVVRSSDPEWWREVLRDAESRLMAELKG